MSWLLLAEVVVQQGPPRDLALYVGGLALAAMVGSFLKRGPQADAEFRASVLAQLGRLLEGQTKVENTIGRHDERIGHLTAKHEALSNRQDRQAEAHAKAMAELAERHRAEMNELRELLIEVRRGR